MTQLFSKQNISYGLIVLSVLVAWFGSTKNSKNAQPYYIVAVASFVTGMVMLFTNKEKFQHAATHRIMLENEKGGYIPGMRNDLSEYVPQEIPKTQETPYANDCSYKKDISSELYEGYEQEVTEQTSQEPNNDLQDNESPITTMTQPDLEDSAVVVPRIIKALPNKRNRGQGDPIRGDLAIAPEPCGWFRPSASPNIDLRQGALNVIAGEGNEQGKAITELINSTSGSIYIAGKRIDEPQNVVEPSQAKYAV